MPDNFTAAITPRGRKPQIRKGIEPPKDALEKRSHRYPWDDMEVGDSFKFGSETSEKAARGAAYAARRKRPGQEFVVAREGDGWACWRVE